VTRVGDLDGKDTNQIAFEPEWWPQAQTSMHHFGAQGPEVLASYQQAFLQINRVKKMEDKLKIHDIDPSTVPYDFVSN